MEKCLFSFYAAEKEAMVNYERVRREIPHFSHTVNEKGAAISANQTI